MTAALDQPDQTLHLYKSNFAIVKNAIQRFCMAIRQNLVIITILVLILAILRQFISNAKTMARTPVYFWAHGGPMLMDMKDHTAYHKLQELGKQVTEQVKPKAIVVISAHWQGGPAHVEVNTLEAPPMLYDYYGFPPEFYKVNFKHRGSPQLASHIIDLLGKAGIRSRGVERGMDHGVFIPFLVAFPDDSLKVPVVEMSLFDNDDANLHQALGRALSPLRDEGVVIIASGMVVHNLRDFRASRGSTEAMPYARTFDKAVKDAVEKPIPEREAAVSALLERKDARPANPTFEHLLPIMVATGAAMDDSGKQVWTLPEGSMSWAMYRFGEVA